MGYVLWADPALGDVRDIMDFVAKDSPTYALKLGTRLFESTRRLNSSPLLGGRVAEFDVDHIREIIVRPYRVIYLVRDHHCYVAAVVHGSRDLAHLFQADDLENR